MKKILSLLAMLIAFQFSYAQWTTSSGNTTTTDNVGIGTTSPEAGFRFDVNGLGTIGTQASARIYMGTTDATHAFIQSRDNSVNQNLGFSASSYNFGVGNVGIGTTSPAVPLDINSASASGVRFGRSGIDIGQLDFSGNDLNIRQIRTICDSPFRLEAMCLVL